MKNTILNGLNEIAVAQIIDNIEIITILDSLIGKTIQTISDEMKIKPIIKQRTLSIGEITKDFGVSYSANREENEIVIADWIFKQRKFTMINNLTFLIVKESFMHFIKSPTSEVVETTINFISILWLQKYFNIRNFENPLIVTINRNIYPETLAGRSSFDFLFLLELLFKKKIDFVIVYNKVNEILKESNLNDSLIVQKFSSWVYINTIKDEEVISPIVIKKHQDPIIDFYVNNDFENSSTQKLAKLLNKHESSILKAVRKISSNFFFFWRPVINYEKIKLHNYFLVIKLPINSDFNHLEKRLLDIKYLKSLYIGHSDENKIIYAPSLISPHITAESLKEILLKFQKKGQIIDFSLQIYNEKFAYSTMTTIKNKLLDKPTEDTFDQLLNNKNNIDFKLKKFILSHEIRDKSPIFDDIDEVDYNLLYFLSFLTQKYLFTGSYGGHIHQLPKLLEKNNILQTDMEKTVDFLNQLEIRARRRKFLSYYLFIRKITNRSPNVLVIESPLIENEKIIDKLRVFGFMFRFQFNNQTILTIPGISHEHHVRKLINNTLEKEGISASFYTINLVKSRFVPLHELFDYDEKKWKF